MDQTDVFSLFDDQNLVLDHALDTTNCAREPIHIPGGIQPQGVLVFVDDDLTIRLVSENSWQYFKQEPGALLGQPLSRLVGNALAEAITEHCRRTPMPPFLDLRQGPTTPASWHVGIHRNEGGLILELEPADAATTLSLSRFSALLHQLQTAESVSDLCQQGAQVLREITGFDRVMVYQFHEDESGEVVGEAAAPKAASYMGHFFPASDIPPQVRKLYHYTPLRLIPDVAATPVGLQPPVNPSTGRPLNLSLGMLRAVSPIHLQYLRNMGVGASMSVAIVLEGRLWGLFACHHRQARTVAPALREATLLLASSFSGLLAERYRRDAEEQKLRIAQVQAPLLERLAHTHDYASSLYLQNPTIKELVACSGCAISIGDRLHLLGNTPTAEEVQALLIWLQKDTQNEVYHTQALAKAYPPAEAYKATASGLLAIAVSRMQQDYILWFRPELIQTVRWAGRPDKEIRTDTQGLHQLEPRTSFASWTETVKGMSRPWNPHELQAARELRSVLVDVVMRVAGEFSLKADILSRLNLELERSTNELDSFAYIASHDLKEPLRGILNYSQFLLEDYADKLDEAGKDKLNTLMRLSVRMEHLLESLLQFSRIGRMEIHKTVVDLNRTVKEVRDMLKQPAQGRTVNIQLAGRLPVVQGDELQLLELFQNLIANAIKYNTAEQVEVEVGCLPAATQPATAQKGVQSVFYVKDNGIGIEPRHHQAVFTIFRRLHGRQAFGGGTGVGLTLVRKIVERHGGEIWLDSQPGMGTTFFFTLPQENDAAKEG